LVYHANPLGGGELLDKRTSTDLRFALQAVSHLKQIQNRELRENSMHFKNASGLFLPAFLAISLHAQAPQSSRASQSTMTSRKSEPIRLWIR
jgi:hypothetical protein